MWLFLSFNSHAVNGSDLVLPAAPPSSTDRLDDLLLIHSLCTRPGDFTKLIGRSGSAMASDWLAGSVLRFPGELCRFARPSIFRIM